MKWIYITSGIFLAIAALSMRIKLPYSYFELLRWVICISAIIVANHFYKARNGGVMIIFVIMAFVFNPLFPVHLIHSTWITVDLFSLLLFGIAWYVDMHADKED